MSRISTALHPLFWTMGINAYFQYLLIVWIAWMKALICENQNAYQTQATAILFCRPDPGDVESLDTGQTGPGCWAALTGTWRESPGVSRDAGLVVGRSVRQHMEICGRL